MKDQFLASGPMSIVNLIILIKYKILEQTRSIGLCGNLNGSTLDCARSLDYDIFIEPT